MSKLKGYEINNQGYRQSGTSGLLDWSQSSVNPFSGTETSYEMQKHEGLHQVTARMPVLSRWGTPQLL